MRKVWLGFQGEVCIDTSSILEDQEPDHSCESPSKESLAPLPRNGRPSPPLASPPPPGSSCRNPPGGGRPTLQDRRGPPLSPSCLSFPFYSHNFLNRKAISLPKMASDISVASGAFCRVLSRAAPCFLPRLPWAASSLSFLTAEVSRLFFYLCIWMS